MVGGCWIGGLLVAASGLVWTGIALGLVGAAIALIGLQLEEEEETSWRKEYPHYRY